MGKTVFTRSTYRTARASAGVTSERNVTKRAEQRARETGKLDELVDPAGFGVVRLSLPRVEQKEDLWEMLVGCPLPIETRLDTTSSMGGELDVAMKVLPDAFEAWSKVTEGYDVHCCTGIFGDRGDRFILCRPQFEMQADKIVKQMSLVVPERGGGDIPEDPDYGIFGGAYCCRHYINRIGLKGYDFTVTDAPGRGMLTIANLMRVFGHDVWAMLKKNGFDQFVEEDDKGNCSCSQTSFDLGDVWSALLDRAHAFVLQVGRERDTKAFWKPIVGHGRLVQLPDTKFLPHVQAAIIGLTEGTLLLNDVEDFMVSFNMDKDTAKRVAASLVDIPIGAQAQLPNFDDRPMKGDMFDGKPDVWKDGNLWPSQRAAEVEEEPVAVAEDEETDDWL